MKKRKLRLISFTAIVITSLIMLYSDNGRFLLQVDLHRIREITNDNLALMLILMLIIMIIQNLLSVIPVILVISVNLSLFGLGYGYIWSWVTSIIGAIISFYTIRLWFQESVNKRLNRKWVDRIERNASWFVFIARLFPFVPSSLINIAAGVSTVKLKKFIISTAAGNLLYFCILSLITYGLVSDIMEEGLYAAVVLLVVGVLVVVVMRRKRLRKKRSGSFDV
ncbi:TVP38/TMEM64 family protein [Paenibacillus eucommiae]|uniref:TVP38/TMEM64 family membrane protein n=1 Tax=Paenibacillus eucommiae TaxID=1355755 RepID=A0ABS4IMF2_9BACL|nr:VTT domain-containing protein [Paenibacillus eucommiae]MBP1988714.1 putative membrane protein YdjX (TVP38/TMEM64 family) [Paenibacillus eucommiae]